MEAKFITETTQTDLKLKKLVIESTFNKRPDAETKNKAQSIIREYLKDISDSNLKAIMLLALIKSFSENYNYAKQKINSIQTTFKDSDKPTIFFNAPNRPFVTDAKRGLPLIEDYRNEIKKQYAKVIIDISRREALIEKGFSIRNMAEIEIRKREIISDIERFKENGVNYVWSSSHANCSVRCQPWQGRLYSLDSTSGSIDSIRYIPLETAVNVYYTTKAGKTYTNGLLGFNCRHRLIPYAKGSKPPFDFSEKEMRKERAKDQKQRYMERAIRAKKSEGFLFWNTDRKKALELFKQSRGMTAKYKQFSKESGRPAYLDRTKVLQEERNFMTGATVFREVNNV